MTLCDGMYLRGSSVVYETIDAINYSTLKECAKSPRHYQHALQSRKPASYTMRRGSLVHTAVLEPDRLPLDYVVWDGDRRGNAWKEFKEANAGREIVTSSEYEVAIRIRDSVRGDVVAGPIVSAVGVREPTLIWTDESTGLRCKGRPDLVLDDHAIVDLKTTRCARAFEFGRSVATYAYHVQAAYYADGYQRVTSSCPRSIIIAVENCEPYDVVVYELRDHVLGPGRDEYARLLSMVHDCQRDNAWPGYAGNTALHLELPPWARGDAEDDLGAIGVEF